MSYGIDANILIFASNERNRWHRSAREFLHQAMSGAETVCLTWPTVMAYLRIVTHSSILEAPLSIEKALANVSAMLARPHVHVLQETGRFWELYLEVAAEIRPRGNLMSDTHVAALLKLHGIRRFFTADTDFRKFSFLEVLNPLTT